MTMTIRTKSAFHHDNHAAFKALAAERRRLHDAASRVAPLGAALAAKRMSHSEIWSASHQAHMGDAWAAHDDLDGAINAWTGIGRHRMPNLDLLVSTFDRIQSDTMADA